jgi:hypothetical protein
MLRQLKPSRPRELAKWCLYILVLLAPGSSAVFIILWLVRLSRAPKPAKQGQVRFSADAELADARMWTRPQFSGPNFPISNFECANLETWP